MAGVRGTFRVIEAPGEKGSLEVASTEFGLAAFGRGSLVRNEEKPCVVRFGIRYVEKPSAPSSGSFKEFASFAGTVKLAGTELSFRVSPDAALSPLGPPPPEGARRLRIDYSSTFGSGPAKESPLRDLALPDPDDPKKYFPYAELGVALLVDGEDVPFEKNGTLDLPLAPRKTGLILEWPSSLDGVVPPGLTFCAKQGDLERFVRWDNAEDAGGQKRLVFTGIRDDAPVDVTAFFEGRTVELWKGGSLSDPEKPPAWSALLETELARAFPGELGEFVPGRPLGVNAGFDSTF